MKSLKLFIFILSTVILSSCNTIDDDYYYKNLHGDWKDINGEYLFSFYDSTCFYLFPLGGEFSNYFLYNDTIKCHPIPRDKKTMDRVLFHISKLTSDTLQLDFSYRLAKHDTVIFTRTKNVLGDDVIIDSLTLSSSSGLVYYPSIEISYNRDGDFYYNGIRHVSKTGSFKGKISPQQLDFLDEKFRAIDYKLIKSNPYKIGDLGASVKLDIYIRNKSTNVKKVFHISKLLSYEQPLELQIFANYVMNMYNHIKLIKSDDE